MHPLPTMCASPPAVVTHTAQSIAFTGSSASSSSKGPRISAPRPAPNARAVCAARSRGLPNALHAVAVGAADPPGRNVKRMCIVQLACFPLADRCCSRSAQDQGPQGPTPPLGGH